MSAGIVQKASVKSINYLASLLGLSPGSDEFREFRNLMLNIDQRIINHRIDKLKGRNS